MISIPKHKGPMFDDGSPGPWWFKTTDVNGARHVYVKCPFGHMAELADHIVDATGAVSPSVVCSGDQDGTCDWHEYIQLEGWP
jgi:hypothetical protein